MVTEKSRTTRSHNSSDTTHNNDTCTSGTPLAPAALNFEHNPSGCERKRSQSDARARVNDLNLDGDEKFSGSFGGAHASFARQKSEEVVAKEEEHIILAPTMDTVEELEASNRQRDPFAVVDSALVSDLICQVHRDRLRRGRRQQRAEEEPIAHSPPSRQLAFTRFSQGPGGEDAAVRAGAVESHRVDGAISGPSSVEVRTVSMLEVARRLRVSLSSLVWALALSDDRREVRLRDSPSCSRDGGSPQGTRVTRSADLDPLLGEQYGDEGRARKSSLIMDIDFNGECDCGIRQDIVDEDVHDDSVSQPRYGETLRKLSSHLERPAPRVQPFGLALGAKHPAPTERRPKSHDKNGFDAWRQGVLHPDDQAQREGPVTVEVPETNGGRRWHLSHEAYIVRDPCILPGQPPHYVFAVPTMPEDITSSRARRGALPGEIAAVTVYCDAPLANDRGLPLVVLSARLAQPTFAWCALFVATGCLSCVGPAVARMKAHADGPVPTALWWATAELCMLLVFLAVFSGLHRWTSAELLVFDTGVGSCISRFGYCLVIVLIGVSGGAAQLLWSHSLDAHADNSIEKGPSAQAVALSALHPLFIVGYRLCRRQRLFNGELLGIFGVLGGLALASFPVDGGYDSSWIDADICAAACSVFTAAWLISSKVIASQLPACALLGIAAVPGFLVTLVAAIINGDLHSSSNVFRWATDSTVTGWWVAVMCLGAASKLGFILSLRYLHTITVSAAACTAAVFSVFWCRYPFNVPVPGGIGNAVAVPGLLLCVGGTMLAAYTNSTQRTHVEVDVTSEVQGVPSPTGSENLPKRSRPTCRLTSGLLEAKQREEHGGRTLYHDALEGLRRPEPRVREHRRPRSPPAPAPA